MPQKKSLYCITKTGVHRLSIFSFPQCFTAFKNIFFLFYFLLHNTVLTSMYIFRSQAKNKAPMNFWSSKQTKKHKFDNFLFFWKLLNVTECNLGWVKRRFIQHWNGLLLRLLQSALYCSLLCVLCQIVTVTICKNLKLIKQVYISCNIQLPVQDYQLNNPVVSQYLSNKPHKHRSFNNMSTHNNLYLTCHSNL